MDEDLYVDETALADALDVQLSTEEFTKYEITKPIVLDFHQIRRKSRCEMCPVSNGYPDESSIYVLSHLPVWKNYGQPFSLTMFKSAHICKLFTSLNSYFSIMVP